MQQSKFKSSLAVKLIRSPSYYTIQCKGTIFVLQIMISFQVNKEFSLMKQIPQVWKFFLTSKFFQNCTRGMERQNKKQLEHFYICLMQESYNSGPRMIKNHICTLPNILMNSKSVIESVQIKTKYEYKSSVSDT